MNEHEQDTLGRSLGRAVEAEPVRETRFAESRLAAEIERPSGAILPIFRFAAAFAVLVLVAGAVWASQLRPSTPVATSPSPSAAVSPTVSPAATGMPLPGHLDHSVVYCARGGVPPMALDVVGIDAATPAGRITQRLQALEKLPRYGPTDDVACPGFQTTATVAHVSVNGDLAVVDYTFPAGAAAPTSFMDPIVQEIVYTASEEPGIRRVLITQNGGAVLQVGKELLRDPLDRQTVLGYRMPASTEQVLNDAGTTTAPKISTTYSVDSVVLGLTRFVVRVDGNEVPSFRVTVRQNDETKSPDLAKWALQLDVDGVMAPSTEYPTAKSPVRSIETLPSRRQDAKVIGTMFTVGLDDLRPWRVALLENPSRIVLDIGGPTAWTSTSLAVYSAELSGRNVHVTGLARAFEANVPWRAKDASGREVAQGHTTASLGTSEFWGSFDTTITLPASVSGSVTLEVFQVSMKDGAITDLVGIPLTVR